MQLVKIIVFSVLLFAVACKNGGMDGDHLAPDVMGKVLLDVNMAEAYSVNVIDSMRRTGLKNTDSLAVYYKSIFAHYKITKEQFSKSLEWYKAHPEEMDSVYKKIIPVADKWATAHPVPKHLNPGAIPPPPFRPPARDSAARRPLHTAGMGVGTGVIN